MNSPSALTVSLTQDCNLKCSYCFVNSSRIKKKINLTFLYKSIDVFLRLPAPAGLKTITFSGGEPLLRFSKLRDIHSHIQQQANFPSNRIRISVVTNGTLLTKKCYDFFKKKNVTLRVSIDGNKITHDRNRKFKLQKQASTHKQITENLGQLRNIANDKYKIRASLVFNPHTVSNLLKNIRYLQKLGFRHIDFYPDMCYQWSEEELKNLKGVFKKFVSFYIDSFNNSKKDTDVFRNSLLFSFLKQMEIYKPISCSKVHLDEGGNFYCCDKVFSLPESERSKFIIGNANRGINNRLRLKLLEKKRQEIKKITGKDCNLCQYLKYCFCPIGNYIYISFHGLDFKQYFSGFCRISQIYIRSLFEIRKNLKNHPLFIKTYN